MAARSLFEAAMRMARIMVRVLYSVLPSLAGPLERFIGLFRLFAVDSRLLIVIGQEAAKSSRSATK